MSPPLNQLVNFLVFPVVQLHGVFLTTGFDNSDRVPTAGGQVSSLTNLSLTWRTGNTSLCPYTSLSESFFSATISPESRIRLHILALQETSSSSQSYFFSDFLFWISLVNSSKSTSPLWSITARSTKASHRRLPLLDILAGQN